MTNLDEKKLDELIKKMAFEKYPVAWISTGNKEVKYDPNAPNRNHFICVYKDGYRQAFADQSDKIKRLEKAVKLMRLSLNEISGKFGVTTMKGFLNKVDENIAKETLAEVDLILKEGTK